MLGRRQVRLLGRLTAICVLTATACSAPAGPVPEAAATAATSTALAPGRPAWVAVSVATLWRSPASPRPVDRPALARPARIRAWLSAMTVDQRRDLNGRADTQALLGERVRVLRVRDHWARVAVPDQPSPLDRRGYPGWVPARQLTGRRPATAGSVATVTARTAWLRTDDPAASNVIEISFGTNLPYLGTAGSLVRVRTPLGAVRRIRASAVVVHEPGRPALPRTGRSLVRAARSFTGLPYLWAGVSGFGVDCSGLTWVDYRVHGMVIPRDAAPQSAHGSAVPFGHLRRGDLMFYASGGMVHHVTMYAGNHQMVQAPHTGASVETVPVSLDEYAGARRYL